MWSMVRYLVGADAFLSYARDDAGAYADRLADRLKSEPGISIYLDQEQAPVGRDLPSQLIRHLGLSRRLVVIVTEKALESHVRREVEEFARVPRSVIPIASIDKEKWPSWPGLTGAYWRTESPERISAADPSDEVVTEILNAIGADRQSRRTRRAAWSAAAFVVFVGIASAFMIVGALMKADSAEWRAVNAGYDRQQQENAAKRAIKERTDAINAARNQKEVANALSLVNAADELIADHPTQRDRALLMTMRAVRRLQKLGTNSRVADTALRTRLEESGHLVKRMAYGPNVGDSALSQDGRFIAAAYAGQIRLIEIASGRRGKLPLPKGAKAIKSLAFSTDGSRLAAVVDQQTMFIWNTASDSIAASFAATDPITDVFLSPGGDSFAVLERPRGSPFEEDFELGQTLHVQSVAHGTAKIGATSVRNVAFSHDGNLMAVCGDSGGVWKLPYTGVKARLRSLPECTSALFSEDDGIVVSVDADSVAAFDLKEQGPDALWSTHGSFLAGGTAAAIDGTRPAGTRIAIAQEDGVEIRELSSGKVQSRLPLANTYSLSIRNGVLAVLSRTDTTAVYDLDGQRPPVFCGHELGANNVALTPAGLLVASAVRSAEVWDAITDKTPVVVSRSGAHAVAVSPDGRLLIVCETVIPDTYPSKYVLRVYDINTMALVAQTPELKTVLALAAGNGFAVFSTGPGYEVSLWRWDHRREAPRVLFKQSESSREIVLSPSGRMIAVRTYSLLTFWNLDTPQQPVLTLHPEAPDRFSFGENDDEVLVLRDHELRRLRISRRGTQLLAASTVMKDRTGMASLGDGLVAVAERNQVVLRDTRLSHAPVVGRIDHGGDVVAITAAKDALGSLGRDGVFRMWRRGKSGVYDEVARIKTGGDKDYGHSAMLTADGRFLVTTPADRIEVRRLSSEAVLRAACGRYASLVGSDADYRAACEPEND